jgi:hypothetical protein
VTLEWVAPEECPDAAHVEREVERLLADVSTGGGPYLQARAEVHGDESGVWHVDLRTTGPEGPGLRTVTAESCQALADATALILALAVDPERVAANDSTRSSASQTPPPPPSENAAAGPKSTVPPPTTSPRAVRVAVVASALLDIGSLPTAAPGVAATLTVGPGAFPPLRFEIGAGVFLDEAATRPLERSGTFSLRTFDANGCLVAPAGRLEIGGCAGAELAWISAVGLSESVTTRGEAEWMVLRVRATAAYLVSSVWAVRADAGVGLDLLRPEFVSAGADPGLIFQPARFTGQGSLGMELRF